jgi:hypothetical protein
VPTVPPEALPPLAVAPPVDLPPVATLVVPPVWETPLELFEHALIWAAARMTKPVRARRFMMQFLLSRSEQGADYDSNPRIPTFEQMGNINNGPLRFVLDEAARRAGRAPKYTVSDQGSEFGEDYLEWCDWCDDHDVRARFGAVGRHGSIAVEERAKTVRLRRHPPSKRRQIK